MSAVIRFLTLSPLFLGVMVAELASQASLYRRAPGYDASSLFGLWSARADWIVGGDSVDEWPPADTLVLHFRPNGVYSEQQILLRWDSTGTTLARRLSRSAVGRWWIHRVTWDERVNMPELAVEAGGYVLCIKLPRNAAPDCRVFEVVPNAPDRPSRGWAVFVLPREIVQDSSLIGRSFLRMPGRVRAAMRQEPPR